MNTSTTKLTDLGACDNEISRMEAVYDDTTFSLEATQENVDFLVENNIQVLWLSKLLSDSEVITLVKSWYTAHWNDGFETILDETDLENIQATKEATVTLWREAGDQTTARAKKVQIALCKLSKCISDPAAEETARTTWITSVSIEIQKWSDAPVKGTHFLSLLEVIAEGSYPNLIV